MFTPYRDSAVPAGSVLKGMRNGVSPSKTGSHNEKVLTLSAVTQGDFDPDAWKEGTFDSCPPNDKRVTDADFYICRGNGNRSLVGTGVISSKNYPDLVFPDTVIAAHIDDKRVLLP